MLVSMTVPSHSTRNLSKFDNSPYRSLLRGYNDFKSLVDAYNDGLIACEKAIEPDMTKENFIAFLTEKGFPHEIKGKQVSMYFVFFVFDK